MKDRYRASAFAMTHQRMSNRPFESKDCFQKNPVPSTNMFDHEVSKSNNDYRVWGFLVPTLKDTSSDLERRMLPLVVILQISVRCMHGSDSVRSRQVPLSCMSKPMRLGKQHLQSVRTVMIWFHLASSTEWIVSAHWHLYEWSEGQCHWGCVMRSIPHHSRKVAETVSS